MNPNAPTTPSAPDGHSPQRPAHGAMTPMVAMALPLLSLAQTAFFLDFDGTLVALAATPDSVRVRLDTLALLRALRARTQGAVAIVSGRDIDRIDALLGMPDLPVAGLHGAERRDAGGVVRRTGFDDECDDERAGCDKPDGRDERAKPDEHATRDGRDKPRARLQHMQQALEEIVRAHPGMLLEIKGAALALHYRNAPECELVARAAMTKLAAAHQDAYAMQPGKMVYEIRPKHVDKGRAVRAFLDEPPFAGRYPVFAGDDLTDEKGFAVVNAHGGLSVKVGSEMESRDTLARARVDSVDALLAWLARLVSVENAENQNQNNQNNQGNSR